MEPYLKAAPDHAGSLSGPKAFQLLGKKGLQNIIKHRAKLMAVYGWFGKNTGGGPAQFGQPGVLRTL